MMVDELKAVDDNRIEMFHVKITTGLL